MLRAGADGSLRLLNLTWWGGSPGGVGAAAIGERFGTGSLKAGGALQKAGRCRRRGADFAERFYAGLVAVF